MGAPQRSSKQVTGSFEKKGGYPSPKTPVAKLPKVPTGPGPGGSRPAGTTNAK